MEKIKSNILYQHAAGHLSPIFHSYKTLISSLADLVKERDDIKFDSFVGTGLSGALVLPSLSLATKKPWAIVRKENEVTHSTYKIEGQVGKRWVFVDDFVADGETLRRVKTTLARIVPDAELVGKLLYEDGPIKTSLWHVDSSFKAI